MAADNDQIRQIVQQDPDSQYYTASFSPYLQGTEIVQFWQLVNYTNVKIRSNTSPVISLSGSSQNWQSTGDSFQSFNDEYSPENYGSLSTKIVDVYNLGRTSSLGPTGRSTYVTFVVSGSTTGFVPSGSIRSQASLFVRNRFDTYISHYAEQRDLGQTEVYDDGNVFYEPDILEKDPTIILKKDPEAIVTSVSLVQAGLPGISFDGVIEIQDIRRVSDRTSIDLPFIIRSPKGSLSVTDDNMKSYQFSDTYDLRQMSSGMTATPYLDYVSSIGSGQSLIDQPGSFSDMPENLSPFSDSSRTIGAYSGRSIDANMLNIAVSGTFSTYGSRVDSSEEVYTPGRNADLGPTGKSLTFSRNLIGSGLQVTAPDTSYFPTYLVAARHGFVFSQKDNYCYDSIAFGGLKK